MNNEAIKLTIRSASDAQARTNAIRLWFTCETHSQMIALIAMHQPLDVGLTIIGQTPCQLSHLDIVIWERMSSNAFAEVAHSDRDCKRSGMR